MPKLLSPTPKIKDDLSDSLLEGEAAEAEAEGEAEVGDGAGITTLRRNGRRKKEMPMQWDC